MSNFRAKQPRRVGSFSRGPADLQGGAHIFFKCGKQMNKREQEGGSTLAGGPGPRGPPQRYGAGAKPSETQDCLLPWEQI